ncbi:MAG: hypothetical protein ABR926_22535 [Streptosporangiaceae bacterium]|jgi:hypothetical protein
MVDVILVATILVFFLLAALLVRALDRMIDASGGDADLDADPNADLDTGPDDVGAGPDGEVSGAKIGPGRPA